MGMATNAYLYSLRKKQNLTLRQAGKKVGIPFLLLMLYEKGYLSISKKAIAKLAKGYGVDAASFEDPLGYPEPIDESNPTTAKSEKLHQIMLAWPTLISVFALFALSFSIFLWGYIDFMDIGNKTSDLYDSEISELDSLVRKNGTHDEDAKTYRLAYANSADSSSLDVVASEDSRLVMATSFAYTFPLNENSVAFTLSASRATPIFSYVETDSTGLLTVYSGSGTIKDNKTYTLTALLDANEETVTDSKVLEEKQTLITSYQDKTVSLFFSWCGYHGSSVTRNPNTLVSRIAQGNVTLSQKMSLANNLLLCGTLFGAIFLFLSVLLGALKFVQVKKKKIYALPESVSEDLPAREPKPLKKNFRFGPFLPETLFRLAGVVLILISSILFFKVVQGVIGAYKENDLLGLLLVAMDAFDWYRLMPLIPLATTLWFFIRIEILHTSQNIWPTIILSLFLGFLYYFAENAFDFYFQMNSDTFRTGILAAFTMILPGNLFWGMAAFSFIVLFLLTTPAFKKKSSVVVWRLCSLLPVAYLLLSYLYAVGIKAWNWPEWDSGWTGLLARKSIIPTAFALFYPFSLYLYRIIVVQKYGKDQASVYFEGNRYFYIKNLIAGVILGILALISYLLGSSAWAGNLGLKNAYWIAILIPFILFYHPHMGKRNKIIDVVFPLAYTVSLTFAYLYLAQFLLFLPV